jgi:hypothetical protein
MVLDSCGHKTFGWPHLYETDPHFSTTYQMWSANLVVTNFHLQDEFLCHLGHLCVPSSEYAKLIWESHYSLVEGHFCVKSTVAVLQKHFYWSKLRRYVDKYIRSCIACVISKPTTKKQGMYTPLPTPDRPWESISMDYMSGLLSTKRGNNFIFVVFDHFSKMEILAACKKNITAKATAKLFFERVWVHFGIPQTIISDRVIRFLNKSKLTKSTTFHPQTDCQIEVINRMSVHILHMYNSKFPHTWDKSLPYVQHSYNRALHRLIDHRPSRVGLGFQPLGPMDVALPLETTSADSSPAPLEADNRSLMLSTSSAMINIRCHISFRWATKFGCTCRKNALQGPIGSYAHSIMGDTPSPRLWVTIILNSTFPLSLAYTQSSMWLSFDHIFHHY